MNTFTLDSFIPTGSNPALQFNVHVDLWRNELSSQPQLPVLLRLGGAGHDFMFVFSSVFELICSSSSSVYW